MDPTRASKLPSLTRELDAASSERYAEVSGRRAALLGSESGVFECWLWPIKVAHDIHVSLRFEDGLEWVPSREPSGTIEVRPDRVELRWSHPRVELRQTLFASEPARVVILLFELEIEEPVVLTVHLVPDFRPMWPAGMGGQIARRDEKSGALLLTEELGRFAALVGCHEAEPPEQVGDHALPRDPVAIRIPISPARAAQGSVPFAIAGAEVEPEPLSEEARRGRANASLGLSRCEPVVEAARDLWWSALREWPDGQERLERRWSSFLERTTDIETPDPLVNDAFLWGRIAIEKSWVEIDGLGRGLVAGLGPSGSGERPGFGWFFDGDAMVGSRAMCAYGDFAGARSVLEFAASHQREDGKMMHELALSAGLCDWLEDYPYAWYKANNTPGFMVDLDHYLRASGDTWLETNLYESFARAFTWCVGCGDERLLLDNRKAGLAAVEAGPLVGSVRTEIFLQGIWMSALSAWDHSSARARELEPGFEEDGAPRDSLLERVSPAFETYWCEERGHYGFAELEDGGRCDDLTAYAALPISRGFGEPGRALRCERAFNRPDLAADWGARMFAESSPIYDPGHYNTGSVFPYLTGFAVLALYRHGLLDAAWQMLASQVRLTGFSGLGFVPEHLRGARAEAPPRGVPHQVFSSAAVIQGIAYGLIGIHPDAPVRSLVWRPAPPASWDGFAVRDLRLGDHRMDLRYIVEPAGDATRIRMSAILKRGEPFELCCQPWLPPLSEVLEGPPARPCGASLRVEHPPIAVTDRTEVSFAVRRGPTLEVEPRPLEPGAPSREPRIVGPWTEGQEALWEIWGRAGETARLRLRSDRACAFEGARVEDQHLLVDLPPDREGAFTHRVVRARLEGS